MLSTPQQYLLQKASSFLLHLYPFSLLLCFIIIVYFKWSSTSRKTTKNLPPSPPKLPIIGNLHQVGLYPHHSLRSLAQRYGPFMLLHLGKAPVLIISSAVAAEEIMKTHDLVFSNRADSRIAKKLLYDAKDVSLAPYGEYWRQMRSICVAQLLSNTRVKSFQSVREEEVAIMAQKIQSHSLSPVDLSDMFATLTNDVVSRITLGRRHSATNCGRKFKAMLGELMELLSSFNVGDYIPWLDWVNDMNGLNRRADKVAKEFDAFLDDVVQEHVNGKKGEGNGDFSKEQRLNDFVDFLLEVQKENSTVFPIGNINIKAAILDMFSAGTDTTYTVLEWAMTELLRHPQVMKNLQDEVQGIVQEKCYVSEDDLESMSYLKAVIKETLRLHPPIPLLVPRVSRKDVKVSGYDIAEGTMVITNAWAIGRDPATWEHPNEFRPERFLNSSIDFKGHDFMLIPFGAGRRGCPGTAFAMAINELALANLVYKFEWTLPNGTRREDLDMTECTGLTIHRKFPLLAVATPLS